MQSTIEQERARRYVLGVMLMIAGVAMLAANIVAPQLVVAPAIGAAMLLLGVLRRATVLLILGGIFSGIGAGSLVIDSGLMPFGNMVRGAVFLLIFSLGWASIAWLSARYTDRPQPWAAIVSTIMALVGGLTLISSTAFAPFLRFGQLGGVIALVVGGLVVLCSRGRTSAQ